MNASQELGGIGRGAFAGLTCEHASGAEQCPRGMQGSRDRLTCQFVDRSLDIDGGLGEGSGAGHRGNWVPVGRA